MNLYLVHCGFYDQELGGGIYECHTNFFVAAISFEEARTKAKLIPEFKSKRMHVDGLQHIDVVGGYKVCLEVDATLEASNRIHNFTHRDLAPKPIV